METYSQISIGYVVLTGDTVAIYRTGLGPVSRTVNNTASRPSQEPLPPTIRQVGRVVGNGSAQVLHAGPAHGFVDLYQINARTPACAAPGDAVGILVGVHNFVSNGATIGIR
jgi:uncharacterized protein (TIGR03437 family)